MTSEYKWFSAKKTIDGVVYNYIVMEDQDKFNKWVTATELSRKLNLTKKEDRIAVFNTIVDEVSLY